MLSLKIAKIQRHYLPGAPCDECYLIESEEDFNLYSQLRSRHVVAALTHALQSELPIHKFDHGIPSGTPYSGIMSLAWFTAIGSGTNPLFDIEPAAERVLSAIRWALTDGHRVVVNQVGGWMPLGSDTEILSQRYGLLEAKMEPILVPNPARWLVLENDTRLDLDTEAHFSGREHTLAVITSLKQRSQEEIVGVIQRFVEAGGTSVWAKTTALDVDQLRRLGRLLVRLGLVDIHLQPVDDEARQVIQGLAEEPEFSRLAITVHYGVQTKATDE